MDNELVLVVPRERLFGPVPLAATWRGVLAGLPATRLGAYLEAVRHHGVFRPRGEVEPDPAWKQIIPYLALRDGPRYFLMRRTRAGRDTRLHERFSIGVGGHLNPGDGDLDGGLRREWREEIAAGFEPEFRLVGLLNDDDDPVGAVHFGFVYTADAAGRPVAVRETVKLSGHFADEPEVAATLDRMESWSRLLFGHLRLAGTVR